MGGGMIFFFFFFFSSSLSLSLATRLERQKASRTEFDSRPETGREALDLPSAPASL